MGSNPDTSGKSPKSIPVLTILECDILYCIKRGWIGTTHKYTSISIITTTTTNITPKGEILQNRLNPIMLQTTIVRITTTRRMSIQK